MSEFKCKENCGECCGIVPIPKEVWEKNKQLAQREIEKVLEIKEEVYVICKDGLKCIFLIETDKKCRIYGNRPQICRNYGIGKFDALSCPYIKPNGKLRTPAMQRRIQRQINHDVDAKIKRIEQYGKRE